MRIFKPACALAGVLALSIASATPSHADIAQIGILSCDVSKGVGEILARKQKLICQFKPDGRQSEVYVGSIDEYGVEIGKVDQGHLIWGVASAMGDVPQGSLAGRYVGVGMGAALGIGGGANALIGGNNRSFTLQPLSVDGETGINIASGVVRVTLKVVD